MINIAKRVIVMLCSMSLLLMTGCIDLETTESQTSLSNTKNNIITTVNVDKSSSNETEPNYGDPELKILYSRPSGSPLITQGNSGDEVGWLQEALNKAMNANIPVDCSFGQETRNKVLSFQSRCGLEVDGIVGPATISTLV